MLVAKAFSHGEDLELVLYPGRGEGRQSLGLERLKPGRAYVCTGDAALEFSADEHGCARIEVDLKGRTALNIVPG